MENRLDIYKTARGWRVGIWKNGRRIRWPRYYETESRAAGAYANHVRTCSGR